MKFIKIIVLEILATVVLIGIAAGTAACYKSCVEETARISLVFVN